jgi:uncharacterized protein with FMN-binding domain
MKQVALSLFVIAASGAYVWDQAGKNAADDVLASPIPTDALAGDTAQPVIPASPADDSPAPLPPMPEVRQQNVLHEPRLSAQPAIGKETTAAIAAPTPKPEPVVKQAQVSRAFVPAPVPTGTETVSADAVPAPETPSFVITPAVYIPIPRPRPDYPEATARVIRTGMKATVNVGTKPAAHGFVDGTYIGPVTDAYYGLIQIQASVQGGRLTALKVLKYPSDRRTSVSINRQALPMLRDEAISAQSAHVDIISGATLTSRAFIQSLGGALKKASS